MQRRRIVFPTPVSMIGHLPCCIALVQLFSLYLEDCEVVSHLHPSSRGCRSAWSVGLGGLLHNLLGQVRMRRVPEQMSNVLWLGLAKGGGRK